MRKYDEMHNPNSCFSKSRRNEMLFVLLGRDEAAPETIRYWVKLRIECGKNTIDDPKIIEALNCAKIMEEERGQIGLNTCM